VHGKRPCSETSEQKLIRDEHWEGHTKVKTKATDLAVYDITELVGMGGSKICTKV